MNRESATSYGQVLRSSSIIGGAQAATLLIGMLRTKLIAVLIGRYGVGLAGLFQTAVTFVGTVSTLGVTQSGVRDIAEKSATRNAKAVAEAAAVLRRVCWLTGFLGWAATAALAVPLSTWVIKDSQQAMALVILGSMLVFTTISGGQVALLQGLRRIGDIARLQVASALLSTVLSAILYYWLRERGIVPVLVLSAALTLLCSWWLARRVQLEQVDIGWLETCKRAKRLVGLGTAFMWSAVLTAAVALATQSMITRRYGVDANGLYQAAWSISGVFATFILNAMGMDFYPRLAAVARDKAQINQLVNEQTEIGVLLAIPGLLATVVFSTWFIRLFYTQEFLPAADLLPWFVVGIIGRVITWPMGYIMPAIGAGRAFAATETLFNAVQITLIWIGLHRWGLPGVAGAFAASYTVAVVVVFWVSKRLTGFAWSRSARVVIAKLAVFFGVALLLRQLPQTIALISGFVWLCVVSLHCLNELACRLSPDNRINRLLAAIPVLHRLARKQ